MSNIIIHHPTYWPLEQIQFDPSNPERLPEKTYQYTSYEPKPGDKERKRVRYVVRSKWHKAKQELTIEYRAEDQQYLPEGWPPAEDVEFWGWGVHILTIEPGTKSGPSSWKHELYPEPEPGHGWTLERLSGGKKRDCKSAKQIRREQQGPFRDQLLEMDGCCALTKETCGTALEAAHIIPAYQGGPEYPENGMLLRADIHRLFDAGKFQICPETGKVLLDAGFDYPFTRQEEAFTLQEAQVPRDVLERIRTALQHRGRLPAQ